MNEIICGDCLKVMKGFSDNSIDLIYCDVLYGTGKDYGDYQDLKADKKIIDDFYIPRIKEMYRVLKDTGSIYIHCDWHINHWLRLILDDIFGKEKLQNQIIWYYRRWTAISGNYQKLHDVILFYSKNNNYTFNTPYEPYGDWIKKDYQYTDKDGKRWRWHTVKGVRYKVYLENEEKGVKMGDVWKIPYIGSTARERLGYPTQKPEALLERIIKTSSNKNDLVADFFCGSGTTLAVAKKLNRNYIGCDISKRACEVARQRIKAIPELLF